MEWEYGYTEDFNFGGRGLYIVNEGNFQYGNASLSFYNPDTRKVENEVFRCEFKGTGIEQFIKQP